MWEDQPQIVFHTFVNENEVVQQQIQAGMMDGSLNLINLAAKHSYQVTQPDTHTNGDLELTVIELEL